MPKRLKQEPDPTPSPPKGMHAYMQAIGRKGGLASGARRLETSTPQQRQRLARKAARARWAKKRQEEA